MVQKHNTNITHLLFLFMVTFYSDDKTWKAHYNDWVKILPKIEPVSPQNLYRIKIIKGLIEEYERNEG